MEILTLQEFLNILTQASTPVIVQIPMGNIIGSIDEKTKLFPPHCYKFNHSTGQIHDTTEEYVYNDIHDFINQLKGCLFVLESEYEILPS